MPRIATQPPALRRSSAAGAAAGGPPRTIERNPRQIDRRPSRIEIRRRQLTKLARPISAVISIALLLMVLVALGQSTDPSGFANRMREEIGAATGLKIEHVEILHQKQTPQPLIDAALAPSPGAALIGVPILNYQLGAARERLMQIPWIAQATVERRLPDTLVVDLTEHDAFAIWQHQGRFVLIDRSGRPLPDVDVANFKQLPLVVGEGAPAAAPALLDTIAKFPAIQKLVTAVVRVGDRRWDLYLVGGAEVLLPQGHDEAALTRLAELDAQYKLLERPLAAIDLRQPDKLVIRLRGTPAPPAPPSATATKTASVTTPAKGAQ
jgi:cell division protein FtsQ